MDKIEIDPEQAKEYEEAYNSGRYLTALTIAIKYGLPWPYLSLAAFMFKIEKTFLEPGSSDAETKKNILCNLKKCLAVFINLEMAFFIGYRLADWLQLYRYIFLI